MLFQQMRRFLNAVKACIISVGLELTLLSRNMGQIGKTKNIYKYMLGFVIQGSKTKRYFLIKKRFSKAFRNMVKEYLVDKMIYHLPSKNDVDKACFEIMLGYDIDDPIRNIKKINNFFRKVTGIIY